MDFCFKLTRNKRIKWVEGFIKILKKIKKGNKIDSNKN